MCDRAQPRSADQTIGVETAETQIAQRHEKHAEAYAFIEPLKHRLFPETFEYVHKGLDGVETTTTQVLFGDLI